MPSLDDDRLNNLLCNLHSIYTGKTYTEVKDYKNKVNPADIDKLAKQHFPLCMQHIHNVLKINHHLKHHCRLQYGLFLKGIGMLFLNLLFKQGSYKCLSLSILHSCIIFLLFCDVILPIFCANNIDDYK